MREKLECGAKRCYACIQWEGEREYNRDKKEILADQRKLANCLVLRKQVTGDKTCEQFFPLR